MSGNRSKLQLDRRLGARRLPGSDPFEDIDRADDALSTLALAVEPAEPPEDLLTAIEARLDAESRRPSTTRRAEEGQWVKSRDGVWKKTLYERADTGQRIYYVRCEPGAKILPHLHERDEHVLVLEGSFEIEGIELLAGDTQFSPAGSHHAEITSPKGCLLVVHI